MEVKFVPPTDELIAELAENLRAEDWAECREAGFETPLTAVQFSVQSSSECHFVIVDGKVLAAFGVVLTSVLTTRGSLWLLTADLVEDHRKTFVKYSKLALEVLMTKWKQLEVGIGVNHEKGLRLASACGLRHDRFTRNRLTGAIFADHAVRV